MSDLINRQTAIDYFVTNVGWYDDDGEHIHDADELRELWTDLFNGIPSAENDEFEWCTDCKEYDQERHCCPRWTKVIRQTVEELKAEGYAPVRHGHWITEECLPGVAVCSVCGHEIRGIGCQYTKYCDECGARMDEE